MHYRYFRKDKAKKEHDGIISVGYEYEVNNEEKCRIRYSVALCSPKDYFDRNIARSILDMRFREGFIAEFVISPLRTVNVRMIEDLITIHYNSGMISAEQYGIKPFTEDGEAEIPRFAKRILV